MTTGAPASRKLSAWRPTQPPRQTGDNMPGAHMKYRSLFVWIAAAFALPMLPACGRQMEVSAMRESMISAAERGDTATVLRLHAAGADINAQDARGRTPVLAATHANQVETVRAL